MDKKSVLFLRSAYYFGIFLNGTRLEYNYGVHKILFKKEKGL